MRNLLLASVLLGSGATFAQNSPVVDTNALALLKSAPFISGPSYRCADMVRAVNYLRGLGKDQALAALQVHLLHNHGDADSDQHEKLLLVCRLSFVNTNGWKRPGLGQPVPQIDRKVAEQFPLFPIALSDGVPFLLLRHYNLAGYTDDTGEKCEQLCRGFSLVSTNLSEANFDKAAQKLIASELFQKLYVDSEDRTNAAAMILDQAEPTSTKGKASSESKR